MISDPLGDAVEWVRGGALLAYPTETVWGLGVDARSDAALDQLFAWKGRGADARVSILVAAADRLENLGFEPGPAARRLIEVFWPGPLTLVLPCRGRFANGIAGPGRAIGVRCSSHPLAESLARRMEAKGVGPITATSLNPSGSPSAKTISEARALCREGSVGPRMLDVQGAESGGDADSTVIDATGEKCRVLRVGAIPQSEIDVVIEEIESS